MSFGCARRRVALAFFAILASSLWVAAQKDAPIRVLFIGNSYTYFNNLPDVFRNLSEAGDQVNVDVRMVATGGWRLKDHWEKGAGRTVLQEHNWDYVVLQDQSMLGITYFVDGRPRVTSDELFRPYAERWMDEVFRAGAAPILYLTWARKLTLEDQPALNYAYMRAAKPKRAVVAPVGIAWEQVLRRHPGIELFLKDGSHPSPAGTYLAACTFFAAIFNRTPVGLPARVTGRPVHLKTEKVQTESAVLVDLPAQEALTLQSAAWSTWQELKQTGGYLDVAPVPAPKLPPLPAGKPLVTEDLTGTWSGNLLFYPTGPVHMTLRLDHEGNSWRGQLKLKYHSDDFGDESLDLSDIIIAERSLSFINPRSVGVDNLPVEFRGVSLRPDELQGMAETIQELPDAPPARLLGTWRLHRH